METIEKKTIEETKNDIIKYWNLEFNNYPITEELINKRFINHKDVVDSFSLVKNGDYIGSLVIKKSLRGNTYECYISFIYVRREYRGFGIGSSMVEYVKDKKEELGLDAILVGSDYGCFQSGIIEDNNEYVHNFFIHRGFNNCGDTMNMIANNKQTFIPSSTYTYTHLDENDREQFAMFLKDFSPRWYNENKDADSKSVVVLKDKNKIIAFAIICTEDSKIYNNGMNRYPKYKKDGIKMGAIGPLGVDKEYRKTGLGKEIVKYGMDELYKDGCEKIVVDWTHLFEFYGKCGFDEICDHYLMYEYKN